MTKQIIAISGLIGSGKDTAADYLCNFHGFKRESFANSLKDAVAAVFGWDREMLEGRTGQSRLWREETDLWWSERLGMHITPRFILQNWGTEVLRKGFHDDLWIASIENKLRNSLDSIVITDCRFENEIITLRNLGAKVIRVTRGPEPEWFSTARLEPEQMPFRYPSVHASEYSWAATEFDAVIDNNGTIDSLYSSLKNLV